MYTMCESVCGGWNMVCGVWCMMCIHTYLGILLFPETPLPLRWSMPLLWLLSIDFFLRYWFRVAQHIPFFFVILHVVYTTDLVLFFFHFYSAFLLLFLEQFLLFFNAQNSTSHKTCVFAAAGYPGPVLEKPFAKDQRPLLVTEFPFRAESETFC